MVKKFGLIGYPINYSLSPKLHIAFAKQLGIEIEYQLLPTTVEALEERLISLKENGYTGVNITQPLKQTVLRYVTSQSEAVTHCSAANTLTFNENGGIHADSTDGVGFARAFSNHLKTTLQGKRVLILGAGGAAKSIIPEIIRMQPTRMAILNRSSTHVNILCNQYETIQHYEGGNVDWIINTSTLPVYALPKAFPELTFSAQSVYDLNYSYDAKAFEAFRAEHGMLVLHNGKTMLVEQAAQAFWLWHGVYPSSTGCTFMLSQQ